MIGFTACNLFPTSQKKERQGRRVVCFQEELASFRRKLAGKSCRDATFSRFPGFRFRSIPTERLRRPSNRG